MVKFPGGGDIASPRNPTLGTAVLECPSFQPTPEHLSVPGAGLTPRPGRAIRERGESPSLQARGQLKGWWIGPPQCSSGIFIRGGSVHNTHPQHCCGLTAHRGPFLGTTDLVQPSHFTGKQEFGQSKGARAASQLLTQEEPPTTRSPSSTSHLVSA